MSLKVKNEGEGDLNCSSSFSSNSKPNEEQNIPRDKSRLSARNSRQRKKQYITLLENKVGEITNEINQ